MLKYLIIQLADDSVSFCHWSQKSDSRTLIPLDSLKQAIVFAMKENLTVQFVYPPYQLPQEYYEVIGEVDHVNIKPLNICSDDDMAVCTINELKGIISFNGVLTIHSTIEDLVSNQILIQNLIGRQARINIIIEDIAEINEVKIASYADFLRKVSDVIVKRIEEGHFPQLNLITDRLALQRMNNCNAGIDTIAICPDGKFYICPGFYMEHLGSLGTVENALEIKNQHLYSLKYAPICSHCDAYHCKRCIKLNTKLTREVNTPSHQQCVIAHIERNASAYLLSLLQTKFGTLTNIKINKDECLDPFERRQEWEE